MTRQIKSTADEDKNLAEGETRQAEATSEAATADEPSAKKRRWRLTRRGFLIGAGVAGTAIAIGIPAGLPWARLQVAGLLDGAEGPPSNFPSDPFAWFEVSDEGGVRLFLTKVEMGQGAHTAIAQVASDELGIDWGALEVVQASTNTGPADAGGTGGSNSISSTWAPLRQAAAALRTMVLSEAARQLDQPADALRMESGSIFVANAPEPVLDFATVVREQRRSGAEWEVPDGEPVLKSIDEFTLIGQPLPRVEIPAKVTGEAVYGYDVRLPNMRYGAVAHPPRLQLTMARVDAEAARALPGVEHVEVDLETNFVGVVATTRYGAHEALAAIDIEWVGGRDWQQEELDALMEPSGRGGVVIQREGRAPASLSEETTLTADYRTPLACQTPLEPQAALADVRIDGDESRASVWASTQSPSPVRREVAEAIGLEAEQVEVEPTYLGGGFGRKLNIEAAVEAARLSKAAGVPVHVGWTREDALRSGYFRPPTHHRLYARLDGDGNMVALEHRQASGEVAFPFFPSFVGTVIGADFGAYRGATLRYAVPNRRTTVWLRDLPMRTGWWRGLGLLANTFAIESFIDELAHHAGRDPLEFRLAHMGDGALEDNAWGERMGNVLRAAAESSGWGAALPAGRARGIACSTDVGTVVAQVAEISLDERGQIRVHRVDAAVDCGLVVNPDGARAQTEGNIMWGVGSALIEEVQVRDGAIALNNFDSYPLLTLPQSPDVRVTLMETGATRPLGMGEPPIGPTAAAIANALFALTGARLRDLPLTSERVRAALA